jgi:uncharacterized repeat protein (TIGR03806 family)
VSIELVQLGRAAGLLLLGVCGAGAAPGGQSRAWLNMPDQAAGRLPPLLSQTGAFQDTARLLPDKNLVPYDLNVSFWADGAKKERWMSLPAGTRVGYAAKGDWTFPAGTVFVKHFELVTNEARPEQRQRLETRLIVRTADGGVYGATYKWRPDNSDADLLATNLTEPIVIQTATGPRTQLWYYPSREDCRTCHNDHTSGVLGVRTRQLNRDMLYAGGATENQLRRWNRLGLFDASLSDAGIAGCDQLARAGDQSRTLEDRARSYLDANCSNCHRPGGTVANFDARYDTPLARQNLINGPVLLDEGIDSARTIAPHDIWRSILYMRAHATDALKMPPLAHEALDEQGAALLRQWIESLPGPAVLPPPSFSLAAGNYANPVEVALQDDEPGAAIRYTLDGSRPTSSDALYDKPIRLAGPATVRAKAFKPGFTKSITTQETFIIGN